MCRFLRLLSEYDWNFSALIIDINDELTAEDEKEINVRTQISVHKYNFLLIWQMLSSSMSLRIVCECSFVLICVINHIIILLYDRKILHQVER